VRAVGNSVFHDAKILSLDDDKRAVTNISDSAVTAAVRSCVDDSDHHPRRSHLPLIDEAALIVGNMASDGGASILHRNRDVAPILQSDTKLSKPQVMSKLRLLPPTAFMSRTDGTPIPGTETSCDQSSRASAFEKHEKSSERDGDSMDGKVPCNRRRKDAEDYATSDDGGHSEAAADSAEELMYIRQTLRTFTDNKDKLK